MRDIKFRAWDGKQMIYYPTIREGEVFDEYIAGPPMQFTGLLDANGVEIYEGDIVVPTNISGSGRPQTFQPREVKWDQNMCEFNVSNPTGDRAIEKIGNIYENEELLPRR